MLTKFKKNFKPDNKIYKFTYHTGTKLLKINLKYHGNKYALHIKRYRSLL